MTCPSQFVQDMENVAVVIADEPTDEELRRLDEAGNPAGTRYGGEILGLYSGVPLTERYYGDFEGGYPDVITIFKGPHERCFATREPNCRGGSQDRHSRNRALLWSG